MVNDLGNQVVVTIDDRGGPCIDGSMSQESERVEPPLREGYIRNPTGSRTYNTAHGLSVSDFAKMSMFDLYLTSGPITPEPERLSFHWVSHSSRPLPFIH